MSTPLPTQTTSFWAQRQADQIKSLTPPKIRKTQEDWRATYDRAQRMRRDHWAWSIIEKRLKCDKTRLNQRAQQYGWEVLQ